MQHYIRRRRRRNPPIPTDHCDGSGGPLKVCPATEAALALASKEAMTASRLFWSKPVRVIDESTTCVAVILPDSMTKKSHPANAERTTAVNKLVKNIMTQPTYASSLRRSRQETCSEEKTGLWDFFV